MKKDGNFKGVIFYESRTWDKDWQYVIVYRDHVVQWQQDTYLSPVSDSRTLPLYSSEKWLFDGILCDT